MQNQFTLGWEFETTGYKPSYYRVPEEIRETSDGSVNGSAAEYVIKERYVQEPLTGIKVLRKFLKNKWVTVDKSCGFHVHLGLQNQDLAFGRLWGAWLVNVAKHIEPYAFQAVPASRRKNRYCRSWDGIMLPVGIMKQRYSSSKHSNEHRYNWLNITEMFRDGGIKTAEIRLMGEERRFSVLYAWIACAFKMGASALRLVEDPSLMENELAILKNSFERMKSIRENPSVYSLAEAMKLGREAGIPLRIPVSKTEPDPYRFDEEIMRRLSEDDVNECMYDHHYDINCPDECGMRGGDQYTCEEHRVLRNRPLPSCSCYLCRFHRSRIGMRPSPEMIALLNQLEEEEMRRGVAVAMPYSNLYATSTDGVTRRMV